MPYMPYGSPVPGIGSGADVASCVREANQDFCTAFNTGNYDHCAAVFMADGCFMPPNEQTAQGRKAIEHVLQKFADLGYQDLRLETTRIDHGGDMAVEIGRYTVCIRQPNGTTVVDRGKYLNAWRRVGAWLKVADCWSSDLPAVVNEASVTRQYADAPKPGIISSDVARSA
jgi:uncharacterized protein (TIGR02246 family)